MSLTYNNFFNDFDKLFFPINKDLKNDFSYKSTVNYGQNLANIYTDDASNAFIELCLPGYSKSDIQITSSKDSLTIQSEVSDNPTEGRNFIQRQFQRQPFKKVWTFPTGYNLESVQAIYEGGILTIKVPFYNETKTKTKKIDIL